MMPEPIANPITGCARHVGRIGALAIALGVGIACGAVSDIGNGIAWAQEGGSNQDTASKQESPDSPAGDAAHVPSPADSTDVGIKKADGAAADGSGDDTGTDTDRDQETAVVDEQDHSIADTGIAGDHRRAEHQRSEDGPDADIQDGEDQSDLDPPASHGSDHSENLTSNRTLTHQDSLDSSARQASSAEDSAVSSSSLSTQDNNAKPPISGVLDEPRVGGSQTESTSIMVIDSPSPAARPMQLPGKLVDVATSLVALVFSPLLSTGPGVPAEPPLLWAMMAWMRRETERFFSGGSMASDKQTELVNSNATMSLAAAAAPSATLPTRGSSAESPQRSAP